MSVEKVVGTGFEGREEKISRWCKLDMEIYLRREPKNKHDKNAIKVMMPVKPFFGLFGVKNKHIGYINSENAVNLSQKMDNGEKFKCKVIKVNATEYIDFPQVYIEIESIN